MEHAIAKMMDWGYCKNESFNTPTLVNSMPVSVTILIQEGERFCLVTSQAGSTTIASYVELLGNLKVFDCALASKGDMWLKSSSEEPCVVKGDMYCGGTLTPEGFEPQSEVIEVELQFPSQEEDETFAEGYKEEAMACGDDCIWDDDYTIPLVPTGIVTTTLGPLYIPGNFTVGKNNVVVLEGVIYVGGFINMDKDCEFKGSGSIVAVGDIGLAKTDGYGTEGASIIMSLNGNITFKKDATVAALIYAPAPAPKGAIKFDMNATIPGGVVGNTIDSKKASTFILNPIHYDSLELPGYIPGRARLLTFRINP